MSFITPHIALLVLVAFALLIAVLAARGARSVALVACALIWFGTSSAGRTMTRAQLERTLGVNVVICAVLQYKVRSWEAFGRGTSTPPDARRLNAVDELGLSASLRTLHVGERGWITPSEARDLFSTMDDQYAFGEMDEQGKASLAAFAAQSEHRSTVDLRPVEGRVYFTRKAA
jgi:hypothetical protein